MTGGIRLLSNFLVTASASIVLTQITALIEVRNGILLHVFQCN